MKSNEIERVPVDTIRLCLGADLVYLLGKESEKRGEKLSKNARRIIKQYFKDAYDAQEGNNDETEAIP